MPQASWPLEWVDRIVAPLDSRSKNGEASALVMWAVWSVDSLYYLQDLDSRYELDRRVPGDHPPDTVDTAHARWASSSAVTAIDLCAASLGQLYCPHPSHERDLSSFSNSTKQGTKLRAKLSTTAASWVDAVAADQDYRLALEIRHSLVHKRLRRHISGTSRPVPPRLGLYVKGSLMALTDIVSLSRSVAYRHVSAFLGIVPLLP